MRLIMVIWFLALIFQSCVSDVENVNIPEHEERIVLQGYPNPDSTLLIHLSKSSSILKEAKLRSISGATVTVRKNGNFLKTIKETKNLSYYNDREGYYRDTMLKLEAGSRYSITANKNGYEKVSASTRIPEPVKFQSISIDSAGFIDQDGLKTHEITIDIQDPPNSKNYYVVILKVKYANNQFAYEQISLSSNDPAVDYTNEGTLLLDDNFFSGNKYTLSCHTSDEFKGIKNNGVLILRSVSKDYYEYYRKLSQHTTGGRPTGPFSGEAVQMYDNVEEGYGIFAGYSQYVDSFR